MHEYTCIDIATSIDVGIWQHPIDRPRPCFLRKHCVFSNLLVDFSAINAGAALASEFLGGTTQNFITRSSHGIFARKQKSQLFCKL